MTGLRDLGLSAVWDRTRTTVFAVLSIVSHIVFMGAIDHYWGLETTLQFNTFTRRSIKRFIALERTVPIF